MLNFQVFHQIPDCTLQVDYLYSWSIIFHHRVGGQHMMGAVKGPDMRVMHPGFDTYWPKSAFLANYLADLIG